MYCSGTRSRTWSNAISAMVFGRWSLLSENKNETICWLTIAFCTMKISLTNDKAYRNKGRSFSLSCSENVSKAVASASVAVLTASLITLLTCGSEPTPIDQSRVRTSSNVVKISYYVVATYLRSSQTLGTIILLPSLPGDEVCRGPPSQSDLCFQRTLPHLKALQRKSHTFVNIAAAEEPKRIHLEGKEFQLQKVTSVVL